jgi:hypothetical protein
VVVLIHLDCIYLGSMTICDLDEDASPKPHAVDPSHPQFAKPSISELTLQDFSEYASDVLVIVHLPALKVGVASLELPSDYCVQQWQKDSLAFSNTRQSRIELSRQFSHCPIGKWLSIFSLRPTCKLEGPLPESQNHEWLVGFH